MTVTGTSKAETPAPYDGAVRGSEHKNKALRRALDRAFQPD